MSQLLILIQGLVVFNSCTIVRGLLPLVCFSSGSIMSSRLHEVGRSCLPSGIQIFSTVVLTNPVSCFRRKDYWRAKFELLHVVRTHMGASDQRYGCVYQREDSLGRVGVHLSKELMAIAGHALKANITTLGPLVLPVSEQLIFFGNLVARKVASQAASLPAVWPICH